MLDVYDRYDSRLNSTFQIAVDAWGVVPQSTYTYLIFLTVDIDWLIHSQVSTSERGGCCWNRSGSHRGSCCQSNYHLLHRRRQRGRWVFPVRFIRRVVPVVGFSCGAGWLQIKLVLLMPLSYNWMYGVNVLSGISVVMPPTLWRQRT